MSSGGERVERRLREDERGMRGLPTSASATWPRSIMSTISVSVKAKSGLRRSLKWARRAGAHTQQQQKRPEMPEGAVTRGRGEGSKRGVEIEAL